MKQNTFLPTAMLVVLLLVGGSVMLYPSLADWWNSQYTSKVINEYDTLVASLDASDKEEMLAEAVAYNEALYNTYAPFTNYELVEGYEDILNIGGSGVMGYVTISVLGIEYPIYHGTSTSVLNSAIGHLQGSSLPVGGINTHAVLSGHRGLPTATLFTNLDDLVVGDTFTVTVLDSVLTYEVTSIAIVLPTELDKVAIEDDEDLLTLMTCTPYGVNTHRLLVKGKRIDTVYTSDVRLSTEAVQLDSLLVMPFLAAPLVVLLLCKWSFDSRKRRVSLKKAWRYLSTPQNEDTTPPNS